MNEYDKSEDPWKVLGVTRGAADAKIRHAYLARIRECPPERNPVEFERIKDAYELLKDPLRRADRDALYASPNAALRTLLGEERAHRSFVGPDKWLDVIKNG